MSLGKEGERTWGLTWADGFLVLTALFWGVNFSIVKFALAEIPPLAFNGIRFLIASTTMILLARASGHRLVFQRHHLKHLIGLGLLGNTTYQLFFVFGIANTAADNSSLILATSPAWVALLGTAGGVERVESKGWFGIALSLSGILLIIWGSDRATEFLFGGATMRGDILILGGTLCWSLYTILVRPLTRLYPSISVTTFSTMIGTIPLSLAAIPSLSNMNWAAVPGTAWLALAASGIFAIGLSYFCWNHGVSRLGSARTSVYSNLPLPIAILTAWLWLGETLTPLQWVGSIFAVGGVILARGFTRPMEKAAQGPPVR